MTLQRPDSEFQPERDDELLIERLEPRPTAVGYDGDQLDLEDRLSLRRVAGMSTELADISEVEYRQLLLERVVHIQVADVTSGIATALRR